ncbi:hypothetical protein [Vagococcus xieshaowenii]
MKLAVNYMSVLMIKKMNGSIDIKNINQRATVTITLKNNLEKVNEEYKKQ